MAVIRRPLRRALLAAVLAASSLSSTAISVTLDIKESRIELRPGLQTDAWTYNGSVPGTPIVVGRGERVRVAAINHLSVPTNIHWHGLEVPNDQDGPGIAIEPGETFEYDFIAENSGTYWYHSHQMPVLEQVDMGLYGALIVKDPSDAGYSGDHAYILDDWYLGANGERLPGTARGMMERFGNVETVNGRSGIGIDPLVLKKGELHKLRFINASTAAVHYLKIKGHQWRVTHTDGHPLAEPYLTDMIALSPGERIDVELSASADPSKAYEIVSDDPKLGIRIPVKYAPGSVPAVMSPFVPPPSRAFPGIEGARVDKTLVLGSAMGASGSGGRMMGGMMMGGSGIVWTINGKSYPDVVPLKAGVGQVVKLRLRNEDLSMMHPMDHPIHIHGAYFQVVSIDGEKPERETWKDTINVPAGGYVDIAFKYRYPGDWMLHCHIIDHEDGGMMMMIQVR
jgi:FtsP/CotA-like multicopper oxidase with cupredoxin domain